MCGGSGKKDAVTGEALYRHGRHTLLLLGLFCSFFGAADQRMMTSKTRREPLSISCSEASFQLIRVRDWEGGRRQWVATGNGDASRHSPRLCNTVLNAAWLATGDGLLYYCHALCVSCPSCPFVFTTSQRNVVRVLPFQRSRECGCSPPAAVGAARVACALGTAWPHCCSPCLPPWRYVSGSLASGQGVLPSQRMINARERRSERQTLSSGTCLATLARPASDKSQFCVEAG